LPACFPVANVDELDLALPKNRHGQSVRLWARSLTAMQKEAIVVPVGSSTAWRLASDEGPYLDGLDAAPCPLAFMTTGMVSSYLHEILALAQRRDVALRDLVLVQDNFYTMEGSALQGTMRGGALPVALEMRVDTDADDHTLRDLVTDAVRASPVDGLLRPQLTSLFTLTLNGDETAVGRVASLGRSAEPDRSDLLSRIRPDTGRSAAPDGATVTRLDAVRPVAGVAGGAGTSLQAEQRRQLHVRAFCRRRPDGVKEIEQQLLSPLGSTFRLLSDEAPALGGAGAAPDAVSYMAAGLAFCFMTQLGRYAAILKRDLRRYTLIQDTHFSPGGGGHAGAADPVETHLHLDTSEGEEFARQCLDMAEQTCFLHALCRTPLEPTITITRP